MNLAQASVKIVIAKVITSLASFVATVVFSRGLGADPLGVYYPFVALLGVLSLPTDFGISQAVEKRISEGEDQSQYFGGAVLIRLFLLVLFSIPIYLYQGLIANYLGANVSGLLLIALWFQIGAGFSMAILRGKLRVGETALIRVLQPLVWLIVGYVLLLFGYGVEGIIYSHILGTIVMFVVATWRISIYPSIPQWRHIKSLFDFGKYSFVTSVGGIIYSWMDVLILTAFVSVEIAVTRGEIGAYENAWRVSLLATFVARSIDQVIFPQISQWHAGKEKKKIERVLAKTIVPALILVIPALVGVFFLSEQILRYLFGSEFTVAAPVLIILVGLQLFAAIDSIYGRVLDAFDRPDLTMISTMASVITNLILNVVLIYELGIVGAAIATTVAVIVKTSLDIYYLNKFIKIQIPSEILIWSIISSVTMGIALNWFLAQFSVYSLIDLLLFVTGGVICYGTLLLLYSPVREFIWEIAEPFTEDIEYIPI